MKLTISYKADQKLKAYCNLVDIEISGMGKSKIDKEGNITLIDVMIFKQECGAASTEFDATDYAKFITELVKKGEKQDWNVWWHSHVNMAITADSWSSGDNTTISKHAGSFLISLLTNKAGDYFARFDIFPKDLSPFKKVVFYTENIEEIEVLTDPKTQKEKEKLEEIIEEAEEKLLEIETSESLSIKKQCAKEVKAKVTEPAPVSYTTKRTYHFPAKKKKNKWVWDENIRDFVPDNQIDLLPSGIILTDEQIIRTKDDYLSDEEIERKLELEQELNQGKLTKGA